MSYTDRKITQEEINAHHVQGATDYLIGNPQQNKAVFDNLPEFIAGKFNDLIDEIAGHHGDEIKVAVDEWLAEHPEVTTTVQDNSLTTAKYVDGSVTEPKIAEGAVTPSRLDRAYSTPADLASVNANLTNELNVLDARMDEFASLPPGSTSGNAELLDIRVGANGVTYPNAGDAVREQIKTEEAVSNRLVRIAGENLYNLFGGDYIKAGVLFYGDTTPKTGKIDYSNQNGRTAIVKIEPNTTYYVRRYGNSDRYRIYLSEEYPTATTTLKFVVEDGAHIVVNSGANDAYLIVNVSVSNEEPELNILTYDSDSFVGYSAPPYVATYTDEDKGVVRANRVQAQSVKNYLIENGNALFNLFDGVYQQCGLVAQSAEICTLGPYNKNNRVAIIPVKPNTTYYVKKFDTSDRFRIALSDHYPVIGENLSLVLFNDAIEQSIKTTTANTKYMLVTVSISSEEPRLCVTEKRFTSDFLEYGDYALLSTGANKGFVFLDDFDGIISCPDTVTGGSVDDEVVLTQSEPTVVTDIYDSMVSDFSSYVSKTNLATVSGYEIAQYDFSVPRIENNSSKTIDKPKIIIASGVHGYEQGACWCLAQFMDLMCRATTNDLLIAIRENVDFSIVPVANPYGFAHNQRKNENGIDINRNFKSGFSAGSDPSADYYGGTTPESEVETRALMQFLNNNKEAVLILDYHNIAGGYPLYYLYSDLQATMCNAVFTRLSREWRKKYSGFPTSGLFGFCNGGTPASFAYQATSEGYNSFTLETPWTMPYVGHKQYDKPTIMTGIDVVSNTVLSMIKLLV